MKAIKQSQNLFLKWNICKIIFWHKKIWSLFKLKFLFKCNSERERERERKKKEFSRSKMENETIDIEEKKVQSETSSITIDSNISKGKINPTFKKDEITESTENVSDISKTSADSHSTSSISIENVQVGTEKQNKNNPDK